MLLSFGRPVPLGAESGRSRSGNRPSRWRWNSRTSARPITPFGDSVRRLRMRPSSEMASTRALLLAGGRGTRLAPYTSVLPKPLMPIGDSSVLEVVVGQLAGMGFERITLCVGYLSHLIRAVL